MFYGFVFSLPRYLTTKGGSAEKEQGNLTIVFNIGCIVGGLIVGKLTDIVNGFRVLILFPSMCLTTIVIAIIAFLLGSQSLPYFFLLIIMGITFGGVYSLSGTVVAVDLSAQKELKDSPDS